MNAPSVFDGIILRGEPILEQAGTARLSKEKPRIVTVPPAKRKIDSRSGTIRDDTGDISGDILHTL